MLRGHRLLPLFPYTTLFRSSDRDLAAADRREGEARAGARGCQGDPGNARAERRSGEEGYADVRRSVRSEEHTSELQSLTNLVCRLLLEKKKYDHDAETTERR